MPRVKILGTGLTGLVGSRIVELLSDRFTFENISLETGVDITDRQSVTKRIEASDARIILHMAAKADVDGCEKDKARGEKGDAWRINVEGTNNVVEACKKDRKKIVYISTDFVFDGTNPPAGGYSEEDVPHPTNWYGKTKFEGEKIIENSSLPYIIARIAYPYRAAFSIKKDFVRAIVERFKVGKQVLAVTDHIMTPTFIDDIAGALEVLIKQNATGIYHVVGSDSISPYDASLAIAEIFGYDDSFISKTTRVAYFAGCAQRPFNLSLSNVKITKLGVYMKTFEEGLLEMKKQLL